MAKYTATYKCGHEEQVTLFGPYSERERKLERMANTLCPHCQREQNEQRTGITLEGSDKQANWAYDIMERVNKLFDQLAAQINPDYLTQLEQVRADYNAHTSAKWWIEEADSTDTRAVMLKVLARLTNKVYAIEMTVGNKYSYVFDTYQIETDGGFTDIEPDWCFLTIEEAEKALAEMEAFCESKGLINCKFRIEAIDKHIVEDIELTKGTYNTGDTLTYVVDGQQYDVTGDFWVDNDHMLHHTHICDDGTELDITTPYE